MTLGLTWSGLQIGRSVAVIGARTVPPPWGSSIASTSGPLTVAQNGPDQSTRRLAAPRKARTEALHVRCLPKPTREASSNES